MLAADKRKGKELAELCGLSESVISRARSGKYVSDGVKAKLQAAGVPLEAWNSGEGAEPDKPVPEEPSAADTSPRAHLARVQRWRIKLENQKASPRDITAAFEAERRAVELVRKTSDEDAEANFAVIMQVLARFPEAREAVAAALENDRS